MGTLTMSFTLLRGLYGLLVFIKIGLTGHLVIILLSLEFLSLIALCLTSAFLARSNASRSFLLAFFATIVCEACLGLGVLIKTTRLTGGDKMSTIC